MGMKNKEILLRKTDECASDWSAERSWCLCEPTEGGPLSPGGDYDYFATERDAIKFVESRGGIVVRD